MIETITELIVPQIIEEWIALLLIVIIWLYHFTFKIDDYDFNTSIKISTSERVLFVLVLTIILSIISYLSLKIIFLIGGIFF